MGMPEIVGTDIKREQAITDMIQSVALQQAALAHILNAEGEKIQAVVAMDNVTQENLLEVNDSVQSMVQEVSKLEMMLQSKLGLFSECLCDVVPTDIVP